MPNARKAPPAANAPAHIVRPAQRVHRVARAAPARDYPPGYFLQPVLAWWPDWQPSSPRDHGAEGQSASQRASAIRDRRMAEGHADAAGTMALPNTPKGRAPAWLPGAGGRR